MASLFGDYKPGAISSFLLSGGGASITTTSSSSGVGAGKKPSKMQKQPEPPTAAAAATASKPAQLFDEATRAKFERQEPLPGLVAPLPKRAREGGDGTF